MENKNKKRFVEVYEKEIDAIFRFCFFRVSDRDKAIEMAQETFLRFWNMLSSDQSIYNDKALLFFIARNLIIDWYRKKKEVSLESLLEKDDIVLEIKDESFSADVEMHIEGKRILEKISELSPSYRQVVYLRYVEGLGPKEIGEALNENPNSISVKINRGIKELKKILKY